MSIYDSGQKKVVRIFENYSQKVKKETHNDTLAFGGLRHKKEQFIHTAREILEFFSKPEIDCPLSEGNTSSFNSDILNLIKEEYPEIVDAGCGLLDHWISNYSVLGRYWTGISDAEACAYAYDERKDVANLRRWFHKLKIKISNNDVR